MNEKLPQNDQCNVLQVIISQFVDILIITFYITIYNNLYL